MGRSGSSDRHGVVNRGTRVLSTIWAQEAVAPRSFRDDFVRVFPRLAQLHRAFARDGLLIAAVWDGAGGAEIDAYLHVPLADAPELVVVGRHTACDLCLGHDDAVALRHVVVAARRQAGELRVRLYDLATDGGIVSEQGERCAGLAADGAAFVSLGRYRLFLLPTGTLTPIPWCAGAADTWDTIPERVYADCRMAASAAPRIPALAPDPGARPGPGPGRRTIVNRITDAPMVLRDRRPAPGARGARAGTLTVVAGTTAEHYDVGEHELSCGILIGRYDRCAFRAADDRLSRVHLLLVRDAGETWAVDTASSNGTTVVGRTARLRQLRLDAESLLLLGGGAVTVRWRPALRAT